MTLLLLLGIASLVSSGVYLLLSRDLLRCVIGLSLVGAAVNLILFTSGRIAEVSPPIVAKGSDVLEAAANPLPQALVLTAIVIGFALLCLSLILAVALRETTGADGLDALRLSEPGEGADGKPRPMEDVR